MLFKRRNIIRQAGFCLVAAIALSSLCASITVKAQQSPTNSAALSVLGGFLKVGGYYLTSSSGTQAIGTPKFFNEGAFYVRPAHFGNLTLTGGVETMSARDHFLPFSGGNDFSLIGGSVRVSTPKGTHKLRPYVSAGYFLGHLRSEGMGFDKSQLIPSLSAGVEYPINKTATISASYRFSGQINGVNTDGFGFSVRLF